VGNPWGWEFFSNKCGGPIFKERLFPYKGGAYYNIKSFVTSKGRGGKFLRGVYPIQNFGREKMKPLWGRAF